MVLAVDRPGAVTQAAALCHVSQSAISAAPTCIAAKLACPIFARQSRGLVLTPAGAVLTLRIRRAVTLLDPALTDLSPRLPRTITLPQLTALIADAETESFSAAARRLGLAQPTVHRAVSQIEREADQPLFTRTAYGVVPTRAVRNVPMAARLAMGELDQAAADGADLVGRDVGRIVIGAMPLSQSVLLGPAIALFRTHRPTLPIRVIEGPYDELVLGLRRGEVDMLMGALRPAVGDLAQQVLFHDEMANVARPGHPALQGHADRATLARFPWVVAAQGTPARDHFAELFANADHPPPDSPVETGSMALLCDLVERTDRLGFVSSRQVLRDIARGFLVSINLQPQGTSRPIGLTTRLDWCPTRAQSEMMAAVRTLVDPAVTV